MENKTLRADFDNPHQNAVVGFTGSIEVAYAYREGFMQATLALLAAAAWECYDDPVTGEPAVVFVDAIVYPICFNARHFIELFLKDSIRGASAIGSDAIRIGVIKGHNIVCLWQQFETVIARDRRLKALGMPLKEVFFDIGEVDDDGEAFRYSHDLKENIHLPGHEHINLSVLGERLREMFKQAEKFSLCLDSLEKEYAQKTFTDKLHRDDIEAIAMRLPAYDRWKEDLRPVKAEICERFGISSNEFSKALVLIKQHREFADLVGIELPLAGLPTDVFARLSRVHAREASPDVISKDEWLRLAAVSKIGSSNCFSEEYDSYLEQISDPDYEVPFSASHILRNAYARNQRLRNGLVKLGQKTLLAALAKTIPHLALPMDAPPVRTDEDFSTIAEAAMAHLKSTNPTSGSE